MVLLSTISGGFRASCNVVQTCYATTIICKVMHGHTPRRILGPPGSLIWPPLAAYKGGAVVSQIDVKLEYGL